METISRFLSHLSKYEWLNDIIPGTSFVILSRLLSLPIIPTQNWFERFIVFFVVGAVLSRIGALVVEPIIKGLGLVRFAPYDQYLDYRSANEADASMLVSILNFYRTMTAHWISLLVLKMAYCLPTCEHVRCLSFSWLDIFLFLLACLFAIAFINQVGFIKGRIKKYLKDNEKE